MLTDSYIREVIADAKEMTDEERAISILYARGDMDNFDSDGQRAILARVRKLLLDGVDGPRPRRYGPGEEITLEFTAEQPPDD